MDSIKRVNSPSSGERKGNSLNLLNRVFRQFIGGELKDLGPYVLEGLQDSCYCFQKSKAEVNIK